MKKKQRKELLEKTAAELQAEGLKLRHDIFHLRQQQASAQLEKPANLRNLRRDVARVETQISKLRLKSAKKT